MPLSRKAQEYIKKNRSKKTGFLAKKLNVDPDIVQEYLKSLKDDAPAGLSFRKKALFYLITFSVPILFFLFLEVGLRWANYKGNLDLFIDVDIYEKQYLITNPEFAARYFFYTRTVPTPSADIFLKEKPENGYRVFAIGGSSAAGYPYGFNGTFSRVVNDILRDAMPGKTVEVVNVGISAISSYIIFDQVDEIIEQKPDAILLYAGHNEFYGALGVGSNETLGSFPGFARFYLKLQRIKTFLLLREGMVSVSRWFSSMFNPKVERPGATLMERIVKNSSIGLDSPLYEMAKNQMRSNFSAIFKKFKDANIPVFMGTLASNLKDHYPFVSEPIGEYPGAADIFEQAAAEYANGNFKTADSLYRFARDLDGLKFRAPTEFNGILQEIAEAYGVYIVPVEEEFIGNSPNGIIGKELMLEHLHPNSRGYFLMGKAFAEALYKRGVIPEEGFSKVKPLENYFGKMYQSEFDSLMAVHRIRTLKQGWPFVTDRVVTPYQTGYNPASVADSLAFLHVQSELNWDEAKVELAQYFEKTGRPEKALLEYKGLIRNQPWNDSPYIFAARIHLGRNDFDSARPFLEGAYRINPDHAFTTKMLGAIEVDAGNLERAIPLLEKSITINPNDAQALYNLSGAYGLAKNYEKAIETAEAALRISPNFPGVKEWLNQILQLKINNN